MTHTAIRHGLLALAVIVYALASFGPVAAQGGSGRDDGWAIGMRATQKPEQRNVTRHYSFCWWQDYGGK